MDNIRLLLIGFLKRNDPGLVEEELVNGHVPVIRQHGDPGKGVGQPGLIRQRAFLDKDLHEESRHGF